MAHTSCMLDKQNYMHARARIRAQALTRTHIHTKIYDICCSSTATMIPERASMLRYTYIASYYMISFITGAEHLLRGTNWIRI